MPWYLHYTNVQEIQKSSLRASSRGWGVGGGGGGGGEKEHSRESLLAGYQKS